MSTEPISWDQFFITFCYLTAMRSKDVRTHVGSVIVGPSNEIRSSGYNNFPMNLDDNVADRRTGSERIYYTECSERTAIYLAGRHGVRLQGCRLYTLGCPCADCARGIIQAGITEVVLHRPWDRLGGTGKWARTASRSRIMFAECGVQLRYYDGPVADLIGFQNGQLFDLNRANRG